MERSYIDSRRGKDRPEHGPRELGLSLGDAATRLVFMVGRCAVVVVMPMLDGLFVEGSLLDSGVRSP